MVVSKSCYFFLSFLLVSLFVCQYAHSVDYIDTSLLELSLSFIGLNNEVESGQFETSSIKKLQSLATIDMDGFSFISTQQQGIKEIIDDIALSCSLLQKCFDINCEKEGEDAIKENHRCIHAYLSEYPSKVNKVIERAISVIDENGWSQNKAISFSPQSIGKSTTCSNKILVFARTGSSPQNMHFDEVLEPHHQKTIPFRVWLPLIDVLDAPLVISNTTYLYENRNSKLAQNDSMLSNLEDILELKTRHAQSLGSEIYGIEKFHHDCIHAKNFLSDANALTCRFFHTLGMAPGELVAFQNSIVFHGSAAKLVKKPNLLPAATYPSPNLLRSGSRYAVAFDCVKKLEL